MKTKKFVAVIIRTAEENLDEVLGELISVNGWSHRSTPKAHKWHPGCLTFIAFYTRISANAVDTDLRRLCGFGATFRVEQYFAPGDPAWDTFKITWF